MKYFRYLFLKFEYFFFRSRFIRTTFFVYVFMYFCWTWHLFFIELRFISSRNLSYPSYFSSSSSSSSSFFSTSPAFSSFHSFSPVMVGLRLFSQWKEVFESFRYFWFFFLRFISNSKNCWRVKLPKKLNALNSNVKQQKKNCWTASKFWSQ